MSYVRHVIQPGEKIVAIARLSWVIYMPAIAYFILGCVLLIVEQIVAPAGPFHADLMYGTAALLGAAALLSAFRAWFIRWTTEIAVTDKRIVYKRGFIRRHTAEMNMDKVSSVDVDQSIWGRLFDFGSVRILGTGGASGIEDLHQIAAPVKLRNAIDAR